LCLQLVHAKDSTIQAGSALASINGLDVTLLPYSETVGMLSGWAPPLVLGFRRPPSTQGWLMKESKLKRSAASHWRRRFFRLTAGAHSEVPCEEESLVLDLSASCGRTGHLLYYDSDRPGSAVMGDLKLMGCGVTLLPQETQAHMPPHCFRLTSGQTVLTMSAQSQEEMMRWAVAMYHSVAIANGGGFLLAKERRLQEGRSIVLEPELASVPPPAPQAWPPVGGSCSCASCFMMTDSPTFMSCAAVVQVAPETEHYAEAAYPGETTEGHEV
jgi:hypothetical protein